MSTSWKQEAQAQLDASVITSTRLAGGDFAESFAVQLDDQRRVFIKTHRQPPPGFFTTEAAGLQWLHSTKTVAVPSVLAVSDDPPLLALQWITQSHDSGEGSDADFGRDLAKLHRSPWTTFGRPDSRTTGSQALPNDPTSSWETFYAIRRLLPLAQLAHDRKALPSSTIRALETVAHRLGDLGGPCESPSLLHGDLWAGNRVIDHHGKSWVIDPAAHGGHREFDIAMMHLFGGYSEACFSAYTEVHPLAPQWQERIALHQLAPLTVHAIKFGGPYPDAVKSALQAYC